MVLPPELDKKLQIKMEEKGEPLMQYVPGYARRHFKQIGREEGLEKGREEGLEKGLEKGREEGLEKGREDGQKVMFSKILVSRFGTLPEHVKKQLADADLDQLNQWGARLFDAKSLEYVFKL